MRTRVVLLSLAMLLVATLAFAGEVRVYDADGQYLGILLYPAIIDTSITQSDSTCTIYIPDVEKTMTIRNSPLCPNEPRNDLIPGDIPITLPDGKYYQNDDCTGRPWYDYFWDTQRIYKIGKNRYATGSESVSVNIRSHSGYFGAVLPQCTEWIERMRLCRPVLFPVEQLAFTLPVSLPLRYEYVDSSKGGNP
jgi:hypothetical protein